MADSVMAESIMTWLIAIPLLGLVTGMRTFTPIAILCWFAYAGRFSLTDTWASWAAKLITAIIFTLLALGEYVGDKHPKAQNRTAPGPLAARLIFGGLVGAIVATGLEGSAIEGIILAVGGTLVGAFGGFLIRKELVLRSGGKDWPVAVAEDISALLLAVMAMAIITA
jgi:uncharacterized membrane protein